MKERKRFLFRIVSAAVICSCLMFQPVSASRKDDALAALASMGKYDKQTVTIRVGNELRQITPLEGKFEEQQDGCIYFRKKNGELAKSKFFVKGKYVYRADTEGKIVTGFKFIQGNYYAFGSKKGTLKMNTAIRGVRFTEEGIAENSPENIARIKMYMTAKNIVDSITDPADTKEQKLYKCYQWVAAFGDKQFRTMSQVKDTEDWDVVFANDIFEQHMGCCMSETCAFAYLAKECGYTDITICSDGGHGWVDIGGRLYDPLFAEARSFQANYDAPYTDYRSNPVIAKAV